MNFDKLVRDRPLTISRFIYRTHPNFSFFYVTVWFELCVLLCLCWVVPWCVLNELFPCAALCCKLYCPMMCRNMSCFALCCKLCCPMMCRDVSCFALCSICDVQSRPVVLCFISLCCCVVLCFPEDIWAVYFCVLVCAVVLTCRLLILPCRLTKHWAPITVSSVHLKNNWKQPKFWRNLKTSLLVLSSPPTKD